MTKVPTITKEKSKRGLTQKDANALARVIRARLTKKSEGFKEPPGLSSGDPEGRNKKKKPRESNEEKSS
ncbi:MAG: hypothetical protein COB58_07660 [Thalassobium sp.]|jgi:hypothetical protein|uniref:hypothetical protein n=1 Tax=Thalassolituus oleivorans TaxID=187493 RepID=UPI0009493EE6|nr:hypothetical protein [Thalassolituus oleivorans]APR66410.1 hypothetical protein CN03_05335 [Thalassolituus oleivorans]MCA6129144.1 hypothetical protein [Thalassolituus oleivorans 4BN06-13]PCI50716.1 MAG: hypothetical protein COB43_00875 [Oceanospirillales bacterium]PHQ86726.1 MAG: hypothetical protein COB58_07660 [Thalassobium sp.]